MINVIQKEQNIPLMSRLPGGGLLILVIFVTGYLLVNPADVPALHTVLGLFFIYLVGIVDDLWSPGLLEKTLLQLAAVSYLAFFGIRVSFITNPIDGFIYLNVSSIPLTVIWIFLLVNMINLLEGLEGLAADIPLISSFFILIIAWNLERQLTVILVVLLLGALVLIKIAERYFGRELSLGSSGSMLVGSILAIISISGAVKGMAFFSLLLPVLLLGAPLLNGLVGLWQKVSREKSSHQIRNRLLHHLLIDWGLTQRQSCYIFYGLSMVFGLLGLLLANMAAAQSVIIMLVVFLSLVFVFRELRHSQATGERLKNVKLLKDIQLNLYQIRDIVHYKKVNGELEVINRELEAIQEVLSRKIPAYLQKAVNGVSVSPEEMEQQGPVGQLNSIIQALEEILTSYSREQENLNYILQDNQDELEEIVEFFDEIYEKLR